MFKLRETVVLLLLALPAAAQAQVFETISIKPSASMDPRNMRVRIMPNGDVSASSVHVFFLLRYAYDLPLQSPRLSGHEAWRWRELYDVEAKAPAGAVPADLSEREKWSRMQKMLRALLADRFKLVMRVEQKTMPVYALTVASGKPTLQKSPIAEKDCVLDTSLDSCHNILNGRGHPLTSKAVTMDDVAQYIENWADLPVVNHTGLSGLFAVHTEGWRPMRLPPPPPGATPSPGAFDDLPTIFTVLQKLGLELKQQEATAPVYTIERIERPSGD